MKRHKMTALAAAGALMLFAFAHGAMASGPAAGQADGTGGAAESGRACSLTIVKLQDNSAGVISLSGEEKGISGRGMQGIQFGVLKIADFETVLGGRGAGSYFTGLDGTFRDMAESAGADLAGREIGGKRCLTAEELQAGLSAIHTAGGERPGEVRTAEFVKNASGTKRMPLTDAEGRSTLRDLSQGLYLVAELDHSGFRCIAGADEVVHNPASPFLISLPCSVKTESGSYRWLYDVTAYPKNQTVRIPKYLVREDDGSTLAMAEDFEIGESVRQVIAPSAPAVQDLREAGAGDRSYERYEIIDTMEAGLSFRRIEAVMLGPLVENPQIIGDFEAFEELKAGRDYEVLKGAEGEEPLTEANAAGTKVFRVRLLGQGLEKLNALTSCGQLAVIFDSVLTRDAKDGEGTGNRNTPKLRVKNVNTAGYTLEGMKPGVFTYRLVIRKSGLENAAAAAFKVSRKGKTLSFIREKNGVYHLPDGDLDAAAAVSAVSVIRPADDGSLVLRGLDSDVYEFTETETEEGYELLKSKFSVTLRGNDPADGRLAEAFLSAEGQKSAIPVSAGTASFQVDNVKALILRTGGRGVRIFYAAGGGLLLAALAVLVSSRRRRGRHE